MNLGSQWLNPLLSTYVDCYSQVPSSHSSWYGLMKLLDVLHFVQVLKGHIALGNARFPNGTNGIHAFVFLFLSHLIEMFHVWFSKFVLT